MQQKASAECAQDYFLRLWIKGNNVINNIKFLAPFAS